MIEGNITALQAEESGAVPLTSTSRLCCNCGIDISHNRDKKKFCSRKCFGEHRTRTTPAKQPNHICSVCEVSFYRRGGSKSAHGYIFCSRQCKEKAQSFGPDCIPEIMPRHYKQSVYKTIRKRLIKLRNITGCEQCRYDTYTAVLQIHHKDRDRANNDFGNLLMLCPTCHAVEHFLAEDGPFTRVRGG